MEDVEKLNTLKEELDPMIENIKEMGADENIVKMAKDFFMMGMFYGLNKISEGFAEDPDDVRTDGNVKLTVNPEHIIKTAIDLGKQAEEYLGINYSELDPE